MLDVHALADDALDQLKIFDPPADRIVRLTRLFANAPRPNPARAAITGVVCGVRVEEIEEPTMREIRYLDKLINQLARGKKMAKIPRAE